MPKIPHPPPSVVPLLPLEKAEGAASFEQKFSFAPRRRILYVERKQTEIEEKFNSTEEIRRISTLKI
jgi:hypothetical protein